MKTTVFAGLLSLSLLTPAMELKAEEPEEESPAKTTEKSFAMLEQAAEKLQAQPGLADKDLTAIVAELKKKEDLRNNLRQTIIRLQRDMLKLRQRYANKPEVRAEVEDSYAKRITALQEEMKVVSERINKLTEDVARQKTKTELETIYTKDEDKNPANWDKEYEDISCQRFLTAKDLISKASVLEPTRTK